MINSFDDLLEERPEVQDRIREKFRKHNSAYL